LQRIEAGQAIASIGCDYRGSARPAMRPLIFVANRDGVKFVGEKCREVGPSLDSVPRCQPGNHESRKEKWDVIHD
jgi:hypothetical protein